MPLLPSRPSRSIHSEMSDTGQVTCAPPPPPFKNGERGTCPLYLSILVHPEMICIYPYLESLPQPPPPPKSTTEPVNEQTCKNDGKGGLINVIA